MTMTFILFEYFTDAKLWPDFDKVLMFQCVLSRGAQNVLC